MSFLPRTICQCDVCRGFLGATDVHTPAVVPLEESARLFVDETAAHRAAREAKWYVDARKTLCPDHHLEIVECDRCGASCFDRELYPVGDDSPAADTWRCGRCWEDEEE